MTGQPKNMKIRYDKETDIVYIVFSSKEVAESDQEKPGIIIDYSADGQIVGIEVLNASEKMDAEKGILYEVAWEKRLNWDQLSVFSF